ncbi:MAG: hypothetical protein APR53_00390 [Methanoculleus sp. SDB]|nr:MAG: hypothetical protein APR53_00390 [Methanoculleus sp. SDB]
MAINQSQVDHIITAASADDPEIKMQRLQEEVDLIKKSIKKLLIDIRERMNETENPFILSAVLPAQAKMADSRDENVAARPESPVQQAPIAPEPVPSAPIVVQPPPPPVQAPPLPPFGSEFRMPETAAQQVDMRERLIADEAILRALHERLESAETKVKPAGKNVLEKEAGVKIRLHKVHRLFDWTGKMVNKYGHDRLEIMVETYRTLGYISDDACAQIKDLTRLMPETIGDQHEIGSNEFVSNLYTLNRILDPADASLDRDMIEVLMEGGQAPHEFRADKNPGTDDYEETWVDMLDRT